MIVFAVESVSVNCSAHRSCRVENYRASGFESQKVNQYDQEGFISGRIQGVEI